MKPQLATKAEPVFPCYASPKLDGIRALVINGALKSRALKSIPNRYISDTLSRPEFEGFDGELTCGNYNQTQSAVMSVDGRPQFTYHVFDLWNTTLPFEERRALLPTLLLPLDSNQFIRIVTHTLITNPQDLLVYELATLADAYEGVMLNHPKTVYKYGRSTPKSKELLKLKRFEDAEALVIGVEELFHNDNPQEEDELGRMKRSSHIENKIPSGMMGKLVCEYRGKTLRIGTGFTHAQRQQMWDNPPVGALAKFRFQEFGMKDLPRTPVFVGFRAED